MSSRNNFTYCFKNLSPQTLWGWQLHAGYSSTRNGSLPSRMTKWMNKWMDELRKEIEWMNWGRRRQPWECCIYPIMPIHSFLVLVFHKLTNIDKKSYTHKNHIYLPIHHNICVYVYTFLPQTTHLACNLGDLGVPNYSLCYRLHRSAADPSSGMAPV